MKFLFKGLLMGNYCFARRWVNRKMRYNIIPATLLTFISPFVFVVAGLYFTFIGLLSYKFESKLPIFIFIGVVGLGFSYPVEYYAKKAIYQWGLEKEYKSLSKGQKRSKRIFAFIFFWTGLIIFFYLGTKYYANYTNR
ncbi:hypothetical protein [uncultured Maribacter sp.]|uniref:hypothetical protein n=1 Tax=uncultured Maribacter sp. TaxID=431308 RepID=UPI002605D37C|nr:hypothetical protein [uncultured Maribacter sp.]